jgi:hypothetical protein
VKQEGSLSDPVTPSAGPGLVMVLAAAAILVALVEVGLAGLTLLAAGSGWCPVEGASWSCGAVFRPRVSELGPLSAGQLALGGSVLSLVLSGLFAHRVSQGRTSGGVVAALVAVPVGGAGVAWGLQPLAWAATGALCPLCLGIAGAHSVLAALMLAAWVRSGGAGRSPGLSLRGPLGPGLAFAVGLVLVGGLGYARGRSLAEQDRVRLAALASVGSPEADGPRLVLLVLDGCSFCRALQTDVLGDPRVLSRLEGSRGVELVGPDDPRAKGLRGAPILLAYRGQERVGKPLLGLVSVEECLAWLDTLE